MHLAEAGLELGTPDSLSQAPSHFITAVASTGPDLGLAAAPELLKPQELLSDPLDCWVFIVGLLGKGVPGGSLLRPQQ